MNQRSVFEFGDEYICTFFYDCNTNQDGIEVRRNGEYLGSIVGLEIPDIEDEEECIKFDNNVIDWLEGW